MNAFVPLVEIAALRRVENDDNDDASSSSSSIVSENVLANFMALFADTALLSVTSALAE